MPAIRVPPGVVRAETANMVPGRWRVANLIRWQSNRMIPVGGKARITKEALRSIPRNTFVWLDDEGKRYTAVMGDDKVFRSSETGFVDITPAGFLDANKAASKGYGSGLYGQKNYGSDQEDRGTGSGAIVTGGFDPTLKVRYSLDNWDRELVFSSSADGRVYIWDPGTPNVAPHVAENCPSLIQGVLVTEEHHLMTFGSDGYPNRIAWSDQGDRTGWDYTRVTGQAGFFDLEGAGRIISAHKIPGAILIFTSTSVWLGRYIGQPYYYGFTKIADGCVPISAQSIAVAGSRVFWMGTKSFWKFEGGIVSPLSHTLGSDLFENIDEVAPRRVCAGFNGLFPEVWFFFPSARVSETPLLIENDRYVIFNFEPGREWWADGDKACTTYVSSPIDNYPISGNDQTHLFKEEVGFLDEDNPRAGRVYAEVAGLSFDDGESNFTVHQCQIDNAIGPEAVKFDFHGQYVRGGPVYELHKGLVPRSDGYLDTHFTARDFSMRVEGVVDAAWGLGALIFSKVKKKGGR